jgi:hypothetical protein
MQDIEEIAKSLEKYQNYIIAYQDSEKVWQFKVRNGKSSNFTGSTPNDPGFFTKMISITFDIKEEKNIFDIINKTVNNIPYMITYCQKMYKDTTTNTIGEIVAEGDVWVHKVEEFMYDPKIIAKALKILLSKRECIRNIRVYKISELWNSEKRDKEIEEQERKDIKK